MARLLALRERCYERLEWLGCGDGSSASDGTDLMPPEPIEE